MDRDEALALVKIYCFGPEDDMPTGLFLNLNDAMYWGTADIEKVEDDQVDTLAWLIYRYGWCGVLYWVIEKRGEREPVEFLDVRRFIDFVRHEEALRVKVPDSSERAYTKLSYRLPGRV